MKISLSLLFIFGIPLSILARAEEAFAQEEAIELTASLESDDLNVSRRAMQRLYRIYTDNNSIPLANDKIIDNLITYAGKWHGESYMAILLLGHSNSRKSIHSINQILDTASHISDPFDERYLLVPRTKTACVKALFSLGESGSQTLIRKFASSDDVDSRVSAIDAIAYADKKELCHLLVPLLKDKRDGVQFGPSEADYHVRVCDLAAKTLIENLELSVTFDSRDGIRYSDGQLDQIREQSSPH